MVFDRMGNIQGVVCDIWLIWLAVLVLRMRCFRACFSTRDGGGAGGDAIPRVMQRMLSKHGGNELLPSSWDGENLQVMFLGVAAAARQTPF